MKAGNALVDSFLGWMHHTATPTCLQERITLPHSTGMLLAEVVDELEKNIG
jgi:hypothetical protein